MEIERLLGYFAEVVAKYDKKLRHIMVSRKAEPIFKDSPEFYIGKTPCEVGWPDDFCAEYEKNLKKALKKKETVTAELEFALPGETKYFESRFIPAKSDNGNAEAVVCVIRDITSYKNAENNQRKSLSLISEIFESVADGILVLDSENKTVSFNKRFLDIYGITEKQAVGGNISERLGRIKKHIVNKDKFEEGLLKVLDDPEAELFDTFEFKDGRVIERRSKPQKRGDEIVGRIWMFHDITEQVDAVAERDKILNNSIDLICIADFKGYFSYINPAFEDLLGYSFAEIKGNPFFYYIHPDDLEITKKEVGKLSEGEMTLKFENRYRCSDGSYKCISWRAYPDISEGTIYAIGRDESEQKAIEKELVESRKKNSLHIEQTPMAVIDWNLNFEVENWNLAAERIFGYTSAEAIGRHASFIIPDVSRETVDSVWNGLLSKTGGTRSTNRNVTKEGKIIVCEWYNTPLVDEGGNVVGVASIAQDVTERIYIEEALRKMSVSFSNLEGEEFLNNVAMHLTESLDVDYALIGRLVENNTIKTYGLNRRGEMLDQIVYPLAGTPCEKVLGVSTCCFNYGVAREFPEDALLSEMGIEGYVGTPLFDKEGGALGIIVLLSRKPIENPYIATATLEIFAERVSSEMDRQKAKGLLERSNRALRVLNESTKALVHAESEDALLKKICEIATETGKYKLAWVGYAEYDLLKRVVPVAHSGYESGYLEKLNVTWADTERGRGPTGTAIRTGKHCVTRDIHSDPRFQPWREEAEKRGFASVISVPLISGGKVFGVMNMYAQEPGAFDEEEIKLLENLAEELSYGIMSIRARAEHSGLTEMLRTSEEKYRTIIEYAYDAIIAADTETGIVLELNKKAEEMVGLPADRIIGMHQTELHPEELRETSKKQFGEYGEGKRNLSDEVILNRKDGRRIPVEISGNVINHGGRRVTYGILRDISQKLESEKAIRESADKYRRLVENSPDIVYRFSNLDFGTFYSPRVLDILGYTPEYLIERPKLWNESIHPEDKRIAEEAVKGLGDGKGFDIEYRIRNARGEWLWFRDRCISILSKDGYSEIEGMATDITERKKAERKIRESEEQYRRLVENSPDIVYRYSHKNAGIFFSSRVKDILGYTPEYLLEHKSLWDDSIHPDDKLKVANAITDMNGFDIEYRIRDAKGGWRWFSDRSISIVAESGDVIVEGLVTDITRRKATEEKLRLSEQKSKAILSTVGEGVISFGEDFGIRFVNRELCGMFGYTEEELLGKRIGMLFPERAGEKDVPGFEKYFAKGKQEKIGKWIEMDGMRKDESAIPAEMRIEETVVDSNDRFFTMAVHDITERRLAWQEEERRARQIIKNQKTLIELAKIDSTDFNMMLHTLTEASSDTLNVARASIWSYRNDYSELVCMDSYDRKSRRHDYGETLNRAEFPEYFKAMGRNRCLVVNDSFNDPRTSEFRDGYALRHGITSMLDVSVWLHGKVVAVICHEHIGQKREWTGEEQDFAISVADMISLAFETAERKRIETALNKNEARMRQSEKMTALGTLTEGIAHDFNNLLTPIIGYTEVTQKIFAKDSEEYKDLAAVLKPARLAKDIVAQLLQFGRKSGGVAYPINLGDVVSENTKLLKSYLPKSVLLHTSIEKGIKNIMSEVSSIQQVLMNLCINAAQAMPNGGMLKIAVSNSEIAVENPETGSPDTEMNVLLEVSDTGTGMEKHVLDRIFEPFFTTKSVGEGTGLGLSLVFGIVQQAGGDIAVESEVGKGTTFRLTFPAIANCENKKTESIKKDISGKETILVVDDEASIVEMCKKALEASGYKVFGFTDPAKALESFMENPEKYDLVICDQNMPKMKGTQFLSEISASRNNLPSILFTGSIIGIEDTERGSIRISEIARKPIGLQEMGMLVRKTIDNAVKEKNRTHSAEKSGIKKRSEDKAYVEGEKKSRLQLESRDDKDVVTITGNIALNTSEKASLLNLYANAKKSGKNIVVNGSSELCKALIDDGFDKFVSLLVTESREQMK